MNVVPCPIDLDKIKLPPSQVFESCSVGYNDAAGSYDHTYITMFSVPRSIGKSFLSLDYWSLNRYKLTMRFTFVGSENKLVKKELEDPDGKSISEVITLLESMNVVIMIYLEEEYYVLFNVFRTKLEGKQLVYKSKTIM